MYILYLLKVRIKYEIGKLFFKRTIELHIFFGNCLYDKMILVYLNMLAPSSNGGLFWAFLKMGYKIFSLTER